MPRLQTGNRNDGGQMMEIERSDLDGLEYSKGIKWYHRQINITVCQRSHTVEKLFQFQAHNDCVSTCRLIEQDHLIVTASHDATIAFWETTTHDRVQQLESHTNQVVSFSIDEKEHKLLSGSWDKQIICWDFNRPDKLWSGGHETLVTTCDMSPQQHLAASGTDSGSYCYWDTRDGKKLNKINGHATTITCCRFSPDGRGLCTCSMDSSAKLWDVRMHKVLLNLSGHSNVVSSCAFSHNNHYLVTASWDKTLHVYDVATGTYRSTGPVVLKHHEGCVSGCDFSKDDSLLASCGYDLDVNIWNMNTHKLRNNYRGHEDWIQDIHFGKNNRWLVSCTKDGMVRVWDTEAEHRQPHRMIRPKKTGLDLTECSKCGKVFSLVNQSWSLDREEELLCVFCRLKDPSKRSLHQSSELMEFN